MSKELTVSQNENQDQFLLKLNQATGFSAGMPVFPQLKFNAEEGQWMRETDQKDADGKSIYDPIGPKVEMHIITTRKMVQSSFDSAEGLFSREFQDNYVELFNQEKQLVAKGLYSALKMANPNLVYVQVLYAFVDDKPYRVKLTGSKLTGLFPYLGSFKNDNPARWLTVGQKGKRMKKEGGLIIPATGTDVMAYERDLEMKKRPSKVLFYELNFTRGDEILDTAKIVQRVNDINYYLDLYAKVRDRKSEVIKEETRSDDEPPMLEAPADQISVEHDSF